MDEAPPGRGEAPDGRPTLLRFGEFRLDLARRGLFRGGERIHLTPKPLETLIVLVENRGRTVSKTELLDRVWAETAVSEGTLVQAVREIRRTLGDDKEDPLFIQTVPREGYRFVGHVETGEALPATPAKRTGPRTVRLAAAVLAVAALALAAWLARKPRATAVREPLARPLRQLSTGVVSAVKPALSPDGKLLLYLSDQASFPGGLDLYLMPLRGGGLSRITEDANASGDLPVFTADGSAIVFSRYRPGSGGDRLPDLWRVPGFGGAHVLYLAQASGAGFSPDGRQVAYTKHLQGRHPLWISPVEDVGRHREIAEPGFVPRWSPDGRWLAYTTSNPEGGPGQLWVVETAGSSRVRLTEAAEQHYGLAWTPDSRSLVFASSDGTSQHLHRVSISGGPAFSLTAGLGEYTSPSVSPDGRSLAFCHTRPVRDLLLAEPPGNPRPVELTQDERHEWPRLSPSGRRAASVLRQFDFEDRLYVIDFDTQERTRASEDAARYPCWLDEQRLAYLVRDEPAQATEVRVVSLDARATTTWARFSGEARWLAVHPSRRRLAVVLWPPGGRQRIVLRDLDLPAEQTVTLAEGAEYEGLRFSPDGSRLAWSGPRVAADPAASGIWVSEPGRGAPRRHLSDGHAPVWEESGEAIFFSRFLAGPQSGLWRVDLRRGAQARIRSWDRVASFDLVRGRLLFGPERGRSQVYAMALEP